MIGYIGLVILIIGYILLDTKHVKLFAPVNCFASVLLTIHAITLHDIPFILVNAIVAILLFVRVLEERKKRRRQK